MTESERHFTPPSETVEDQRGLPMGPSVENVPTDSVKTSPLPPPPHIDYGKPDKPAIRRGERRLFYHEATPVAFNELLRTDPYFATNWRLIPKLFRLLNRILRWNARDQKSKGGQSEIWWRSLYHNLGRDYAAIVRRLESLGLLLVERDGRGTKEDGVCYAYRLTEKCHALLSDANREYLHKLLTDKPTRRRLQKNISARGYHKKVYGDVRDELKATIDGISYKKEVVNRICDHFPDEKAAFVRSVLFQIEEKKYGDLERNETDNRIPNPYTQLPAIVKSVIRVNGLSYVTTHDIRSAYPSMWAHWLCYLHPERKELLAEKAAFEGIFLDPAIDLKPHLSTLTGIPAPEIKDVMIAYFNGKGFRKNKFAGKRPSDPYVKFDSWIRSSFPNLYRLWTETDVTQTGNQIGKLFETKLMLDGSLFRKARSLGLVLGYENDGFSIFGNVGVDHPSIREMLEFVTEQSERLLGIRLVFKEKCTPKWDPFDVIKRSYEERADTLWDNWRVYCRRIHSLPPEQRNRSEFETRKSDVTKGLQKCVRVLERIQAKAA